MILYNSKDETIVIPEEYSWKGKKIVFDGTSLFANDFALPEIVSEILGAICYNRCPRGGSIGEATIDDGIFYFRRRVSKYDYDADAICIEIDANANTPLTGTIDSMTESTWFGKYNLYLKAVRESFPTIPIFLISDWNVRTSRTADTLRTKFLNLSNAVRQLAGVYGCIHIDCTTLSQFNMVNEKSCLAFSRNGNEDHQNREVAQKYLYPYIAKRITGYKPIEGYNETNITLSDSSVRVRKGENITVKATLTPRQTIWQTNAWSSDDESVALVCGGVITGVSVGTTTVRVKTKHGIVATCSVTVTN